MRVRPKLVLVEGNDKNGKEGSSVSEDGVNACEDRTEGDLAIDNEEVRSRCLPGVGRLEGSEDGMDRLRFFDMAVFLTSKLCDGKCIAFARVESLSKP